MVLMDRKEIAEYIKENDIYVMKESDIDSYAGCLAESFKDYPLFEYFSDNKYDIDKMKVFWKVTLKMCKDQYLCISNEPNATAVFICVPPKCKSFSVLKYILNGGLKIIGKFGFKNTKKMLNFEEYSKNVRERYSDDNTWYLYALCVKPEYRNKKYGGTLMRSALGLINKLGDTAYLETFKEVNVDIYSHYGFELKETTKVPNTDLTMYSMTYKKER